MWITVPPHTEIYGNGRADKLAGEGVATHGKGMQAKKQQEPLQRKGDIEEQREGFAQKRVQTNIRARKDEQPKPNLFKG